MVEIRFNKKRVRKRFFYALGFLILSLLFFVSDPERNFLAVVYLLIGLLFFIEFYFQTTKPYVTITKDAIREFSYLNKKTILVKDITSIKAPFNDFIIRSEKKEMIISHDKMDQQAYDILRIELQNIQKQRGF